MYLLFHHVMVEVNAFEPGLFEPEKNVIREGEVSGIRLELVNEDVGAKGDRAVMPKKGAETVYSQLWSQLWRSF